MLANVLPIPPDGPDTLPVPGDNVMGAIEQFYDTAQLLARHSGDFLSRAARICDLLNHHTALCEALADYNASNLDILEGAPAGSLLAAFRDGEVEGRY